MRKRGLVRDRICRVLLNNPGGMTKYRLAKEAGANISWVIKVLRDLEAAGMVKGAAVADYRRLSLHWAGTAVRPYERRYAISSDITGILNGSGMRYAFTTFQAENMVQLYLFRSSTDFYVMPGDLERWHRLLCTMGPVGGGNVSVRVAGEHVFYGSIEVRGRRMVSIPQLAADLRAEGGSAVDAADMLIERLAETEGKIGVPRVRV